MFSEVAVQNFGAERIRLPPLALAITLDNERADQPASRTWVIHEHGPPRNSPFYKAFLQKRVAKGATMNQIIYIVGLVVIVIAVLSFFGLR